MYYEQFERVSDAYYREKQVQGRGRAKRLALINGDLEELPPLSRKDFSCGGAREVADTGGITLMDTEVALDRDCFT